MNSYANPEYAEVNGKKYKINTDFRVVLRCEEVANDNNITDTERALAIVFLLFGKEGLKDANNINSLLKIAIKFIKCGQDDEESSNDDPDMSFKQDWGKIKASFISDHNINLDKVNIHWWDFYNLLEGLTEKCILNRTRFIRNFDISKIEDVKERNEWLKMKQKVALKREKTLEELEIDNLVDKLMKGE